MNWILVLSMISAPNGNYVKVFDSEKQCVVEMNKIIRSLEKDSNDNVKGIACVPADYASAR